jgi:hypothetical protein
MKSELLLVLTGGNFSEVWLQPLDMIEPERDLSHNFNVNDTRASQFALIIMPASSTQSILDAVSASPHSRF